jgi:DNA-binding GntR family transcriptional regulator
MHTYCYPESVVISVPAAQQIYEATKEQILSGELSGGTLLSEADVARRFQVSRTPTREAFVRLEAEGLLTLLPRRGAVVASISMSEVYDLLELREALEISAARRLVRRVGHEERLASARCELAIQVKHASEHDVESFAESDQRFHQAIVDAGGNVLASGFYVTLGDRQRLMTIGAVGAEFGKLNDLLVQHRELLACIEDRDVDEFAQALRLHLESTHGVLLGR